jgi:hypothetical protein
MKDSSLSHKLAHEMKEFLAVFLFLAPFFLSITNYRMYLQGNFSHPLLAYAIALFNALVLSKIILLGELIHLGGRFRNRALLFITIDKAAVFTVLYFMVHLLEDGVRGSLHGKGFLESIHAEAFSNIGGLFARLLFVFFAFIPFFALMETRRVLGVDRFRELFLGATHRRNGSNETPSPIRTVGSPEVPHVG